MDVVTGALGSLLPKLFKLLGDEYKLHMGMKEKVKFLTEELQSIQAFLLKVGAVPWDELDNQVQVWASEAREASYDMEDILDTFFVHVEVRGPAHPSRLKGAMNKLENLFSKGKARHDVGWAIKDMKNRLQVVADRRNRYKINDIVVNPAATSTVDPRLKAMYKEVASLVGIEEPSKNLISKLSVQGDDMPQRRKIVAIVGIGGLGKTTLAKAVYDKLRVEFDCGAFVPVGRKPNMTNVLVDILYELDKNKYSDISTNKNKNPRQLIDDLREFLVDKRYLIVIDDIWENKSWEETIELALLENNRGSRIIITTRNIDVATKVGAQVHKMQPLADDSSEKLFYTRISGDDVRCTDNQPTDIAKQILKKCNGVPLAIITMASLLVGKPRERWSDVFTSIGFGNKDDTEVVNTMKILSYSYYDMSAHLRTCLLYLSIFPEDYTINKETLIWKWIAEGFVQGEQGKIWLFQLGEQYFNDLLNRSMIQAKEEDNCVVYGCHIHDMVLDLIRSISSKENFVSILDNNEGTLSSPPCSARRLALHDNIMVHTAQGNMVDMPQVRSFITIKCDFGNRAPLSRFKVLRVLEMNDCNHVKTSHLVHLGNLVHLRYLGLQGTLVNELPNEIGALKLLQILNIDETNIRELTPSISRLTQLVCLKCDLEGLVAPNWIGKLTSLEELQIPIVIDEEDEEENNDRIVLKELGNLRELRVFRCSIETMDDNMQRDLLLSLNNLHKLEYLSFLFRRGMINDNIAVWEDAGFVLPRHIRFISLYPFTFSRLPSCISAMCHPNLTHLRLSVAAVDEKGLESLGRLPELCYLFLRTKSTTTMSNISADNGFFQKLRSCAMYNSMIQFQCKDDDSTVSFHIWNGINAMPFSSGRKNCSFSPSAVMPNLERIGFCIFVRALKDGDFDFSDISLQYLPSLQHAEVFIDCAGASAAEVDEAEAALRNATEVHPNRPVLKLNRCGKHKMIPTDEEDEVVLVSTVQDEKHSGDDNVPAKEERRSEAGEGQAEG